MKALVLFFLCFATPALADDGQVVTLTPLVIDTLTPKAEALSTPTAPAPAEVNLLPECTDVIDGTTPAGVAGYFAAALVALRLLAEGLGFLATKGSTGAGAASRVVTYMLSALGFLAGRMGWGKPKSPAVHQMPKLSSLQKDPEKDTSVV